MKVQDLFIIFLKLLGIYIIVLNIQSILSYIPLLSMDGDYGTLFFTLGALFAIIILVFVLFKYTDVILKFVVPEKGLVSTTIDFGTINKESLLEIGVVLISLYLIIDNLQVLVIQGFYSFKSKVEYQGLVSILDNSHNTEGLKYAVVSIVLGLVLIAVRKYVSKLF